MSCELTTSSSKHAVDISIPVIAPASNIKDIMQPKTFLVQKSKNKYLKNVFPAGFGVNSSREVESFHAHTLRASSDNLSMQSLTSPSKSINYIPSHMQISEGNNSNKQYFSWTNGEFNNSIMDNMTDNLSDQNLDAFADVAGPYFASSLGFSRPTTNDYNLFRSQIPVKEGDVDFSNSIIAREIPLRTSTPGIRVKSARTKTPMTPKVYQVPAELPKLKPFTAKTSQQQHQHLSDNHGINIAAQYDEWLQYHRTHPEAAINHEFSILSGTETAVMSMKPITLTKSKGQVIAPKSLLPYIMVDLTSFKDMMRPTRLQHSQLYKLPSNCDFEYLRRTVIKIAELNTKVEKSLTLKYFNHLTNCWKPLSNQEDWSHVVYLNQDSERDAVGLPVAGPIRIIYTVSQDAELIEAIKEPYVRKKVKAVTSANAVSPDKSALATPRTLTLSLITDNMSEEMNDDNTSIGTKSSLGRSITSIRKKNPPAKMNQFVPKLLFMPPKPDVHSSSIVTDHTTMPAKPVKSKEDALAKILEQRLLKTKW